MKAYFIERYGKGTPLIHGDQPEPELRDNDLLVEIRAASVNQLDAKIRTGEFRMVIPHKMPLILGHDLAGVVLKTGPRVTGFKPGDEVYGCLPVNRIGGFAERVAVDASFFARKPANLTMVETASLPVVALTAWQSFVEIAKLKPGQRVFIQAGSGGVGTVAIQLARHIGAEVATTAGAARADTLKALGANIVIDYRKDDFARVLKDYDVALMSQDEASLKKAIGILKPGATAISISGPPDTAFARQAGLNPLLRLVMWGLSHRVRAAARKAGVTYAFLFMQPGGEMLRKLNPMLEDGSIRPVMDKVFPFAQTPEAIAYVETGRAKGKVVVEVKPV